jgi:hypothetical protein
MKYPGSSASPNSLLSGRPSPLFHHPSLSACPEELLPDSSSAFLARDAQRKDYSCYGKMPLLQIKTKAKIQASTSGFIFNIWAFLMLST